MVFTLADLDRIRDQPGKSCLLFLTDRCPVGCAHCSVDSRRDSPRIEDRALFREMVGGVLSIPGLELVGISGGEPFMERQALSYAVRECAARGLQVVLYTSGVWAVGGEPGWASEVCELATAVVLSTDAFHAPAVNAATLRRVGRRVMGGGRSLIVQTVDLPASREPALLLVEHLRSTSEAGHVELSLVPPLSTGRGKSAFAALPSLPRRTLADWGACGLLGSPVIRHDGTVIACCNEAVLMGAGPARLRRSCRTAAEVAAAVAALRDDPLLECIRTVGMAATSDLPWVDVPPDRSFGSICEACWELSAQADAAGARGRRTLKALAAFAASSVDDRRPRV
ncbi:radical SAM protein [Geodermatophilus sp. SYSU D01180]